MRRALALVVAGALAAVAAGVAPEQARACSCAQSDLANELQTADAVFIGTMLSRRIERRTPGVDSPDDVAATRFRVETLIKGDLDSPVEVVSSVPGGGTCGIEVEPGERTGLLLRFVDRRWSSDLCNQVEPARLLAAAGLGDGENEEPGAHFPSLNVGGYVFGTFVLGLLALLLARRTRRYRRVR